MTYLPGWLLGFVVAFAAIAAPAAAQDVVMTRATESTDTTSRAGPQKAQKRFVTTRAAEGTETTSRPGPQKAQMGDLLLGFPGVMAMSALWNAAIGFVWLPVMRNGDTWHAWPGVFVAIALLLFAPWGALLGLVAFVMSSVIMAPVMRFVPKRTRTNVLLSSSFLVLAAISFVIGRTTLPLTTFLQVLVEAILLPIGIVLAGVAMSRGRALFAPIAASVLFIAAFTVWMARDYYYAAAP